MNYLKRVLTAKGTERRRNENIREELVIHPVEAYLEDSKLIWFRHLVRMGDKKR